MVLQLQAWFLGLNEEQDLEQARRLLQTLVLKTPGRAIFAMTGSSMCTVWANVAAMTHSGTSMLLHIRRCTLPSEVSPQLSAATWRFMQDRCPRLPRSLAKYAVGLPSVVVFLSKVAMFWQPRPADAASTLSFVQEVETWQLQMEVCSLSKLYACLYALSRRHRTEFGCLGSKASLGMSCHNTVGSKCTPMALRDLHECGIALRY